MRSPLLVAAIALCGAAIPIRAQDAANPRAVQPERPTVATHAHTVAPGYVELEAGLEGDRYARNERALVAPIVLKVGLASHLQLNLGTTQFTSVPAIGQGSGMGDVSIGLKWRLLDDDALLGDFAVLPTLKLATGSVDRGTGTGTQDVGITLISSRELGPVAMDLNATYTRIGSANGISAGKAALWTASFGFPVARQLGWVAEVFGVPTIDGSGAPSSVEFLTGPTWLVSPALNLDLGLITPIHGDRPNALYAGLVWNAGRIPGFPGGR